MLMNLGTVQSHLQHQIWVAPVHLTLHQAPLLGSFAGTGSLTIVHTGKAALAMEF